MAACHNLCSDLCAFCQREDADPKVVGKTFSKGSLVVHEFCLYFSSGLCQQTSTDKGIQGFLLSDIRKELLRGRKHKSNKRALRCFVCDQADFFVGCAEPKCRKAGHFPCLVEAEFLFQYSGDYKAFCPEHRPRQSSKLCPSSHTIECCICLTEIPRKEALSSFQVLFTPCCRRALHRACVQRQARSAGLHFFRCPICNDKKAFVKEMIRMGLEIPDRDASWESQSDWYYDYSLDYQCRVTVCRCREGRDHFSSNYPAVRCKYCSQCIGHDVCVKSSMSLLNHDGNEFICEDCSVPSVAPPSLSLPPVTRPSEEEEEVEVCVVIDSDDVDSDCFIVERDEQDSSDSDSDSEDSSSEDSSSEDSE